MRNLPTLLMAAGALHAAVIHGNVVENQTGYPLARATVSLAAVGRADAVRSVHTSSSGTFEFGDLPAGLYLLSAAKLAFAPVEYGQKTWRSSGTPLRVADTDPPAVTIRLPRYGAVAGSVLDENEIGLIDHEIAVYTNARPPRLLLRTHTDDRGMYRISGLAPGSYLVRSMSKMYRDGGYLPTFYRDSATVDQARAVEVTLDEQVDHVDFHPAAGRLYSVAVRVRSDQPGQSSVALTSDTGTEYASADSRGNSTFNPMAPGRYELLALGPSDRGRERKAGYQTLSVDRDLSDIYVALSPLPAVQFLFVDAKGRTISPEQLKVMARRIDLAADFPARTLNVSGKVTLLPGRWDVAVAPAADHCVVGFHTQPGGADQTRADGWNEIYLAPGSENVVTFVLSSSPATLTGLVRNANDEPVAGVPVFLEPYDLEPAKRIAAFTSTRTDSEGRYRFDGLAPGAYRLLGTFEYRNPGAREMETAAARTIKLEEGANAALDLAEFVLR